MISSLLLVIGLLYAVREQYPDGEETFVHSSVNDRLLYAMYKVEKRQ